MTALNLLKLQHHARQLREIAAELRAFAPLESVRLEGVASGVELRIDLLTRLAEISS